MILFVCLEGEGRNWRKYCPDFLEVCSRWKNLNEPCTHTHTPSHIPTCTQTCLHTQTHSHSITYNTRAHARSHTHTPRVIDNNPAPQSSSLFFHINAILIPSTSFSFKGTSNCLDHVLWIYSRGADFILLYLADFQSSGCRHPTVRTRTHTHTHTLQPLLIHKHIRRNLLLLFLGAAFSTDAAVIALWWS